MKSKRTTRPRPTRLLACRAAPLLAAPLLVAPLLLAGCRKEDMAQQPRYDTMDPSNFFPDGLSARPLVEGTVARRGVLDAYGFDRLDLASKEAGDRNPPGPTSRNADGSLKAATKGGRVAHSGPTGYVYEVYSSQEKSDFPADFPQGGEELHLKLERGRERFNIYCTPCHGELGNGNGMIVQRGMIRPPSFHENRLRQANPGHFYDVMTNGYGAMYSYAARIAPDDRWAIIAYVRALQLSQAAPFDQLNEQEKRDVLEAQRNEDRRLREEAAARAGLSPKREP